MNMYTVSFFGHRIIDNFNKFQVDDNRTYGKAIGAANAIVSNQENDMKQVMRRANNQQKK